MRVLAAVLCFLTSLAIFGYSIPNWVKAEKEISFLGDQKVRAFERELPYSNHLLELKNAKTDGDIANLEGHKVDQKKIDSAQAVVDKDDFEIGMNQSYDELSLRESTTRHEERFYVAYFVAAVAFLIGGLALMPRRKVNPVEAVA